MLIAIGPGVTGLKDYTSVIDYNSIQSQSIQGDTLDTCKCQIWDYNGSATADDEDDIVFLDEADPTGFPTVNLAPNPNTSGTYVSGIAPSWTLTGNTTGVTGSAAGSPLYGTNAQQLAFSNVAVGTTSLYSQVQLPQDENLAVLTDVPYFFSVSLKVTAAFTNITGDVHVDWYDVSSAFISTSTTTAVPLGSTTGWVRFSTLGVAAPVNAYYARITVRLTISNSTNSGTILVNGAQFERATFGYLPWNWNGNALANNIYPTAYCDANQPGCYVETGISGLAFRQLRLFAGLVKIAESKWVGPARTIDVSGVDYSILLQEAPATFVLYQTSDYNAIQQAFTYAQNQGFLIGINSTTYVSTIMTVDAHLYSWSTTREVLSQIANQTVAAFWIDYYKFLHYAPALATNAPFALSDHPDMSTSFPYAELDMTNDATDSRTSPVIEGSTQLSQPVTEKQNGDGTTVTFTVNSGNPIQQVDSVTVGGVAQTVGLYNVNTYAQGYAVLLNPQNAQFIFQTAPAAGANNVIFVYRYAAPVIVRVQNPNKITNQGHRHRKIHHHQKFNNITSQKAAIDRANADLSIFNRARPIGSVTLYSPPAPTAVPLRPGTAIAITHGPAHFNLTLFQIQEVDLYPLGNGVYKRTLQLGFYKPDFAIRDAQATREQAQTTDPLSGNVLSDVLNAIDGWMITDNPPTGTVQNQTKWGPSTTTTYNGSNVYG